MIRKKAGIMIPVLTAGLIFGVYTMAFASEAQTEKNDTILQNEVKEEEVQNLEILYAGKIQNVKNYTEKALELYVKSIDSEDWGTDLMKEPRESSEKESGLCDIQLVGEKETYRYLGIDFANISDLKLYKTETDTVYITYKTQDGKEISTEKYPLKIFEEPKKLYATASVYIRELPDKNAKELSAVEYGSENRIFGQTESESGVWYVIKTGDVYGYTFGEYYSETQPVVHTWEQDYDYSDDYYDYDDYDEEQVLINCDGTLDDGSVDEESIY